MATGPASDGGRARVPSLKVDGKEITTNAGKSAALFDAFFPKPPLQTSVPQGYSYPRAKWTFSPVTDQQVDQSIGKMMPHKATRPGTPPNSVLIYNRAALVPHLAPLFRATHALNHYPSNWSNTLTVVLRKPGKPDYGMINAWRPIVLSHGFARLLNSCLTEDMTTACEHLNILPAHHFGARPGRTTTDSLHLLTKTIKDAWRAKKVASVLFLDVKGAFPSVDILRLIHNMRAMGIPRQYTDWMRQNRHCCPPL